MLVNIEYDVCCGNHIRHEQYKSSQKGELLPADIDMWVWLPSFLILPIKVLYFPLCWPRSCDLVLEHGTWRSFFRFPPLPEIAPAERKKISTDWYNYDKQIMHNKIVNTFKSGCSLCWGAVGKTLTSYSKGRLFESQAATDQKTKLYFFFRKSWQQMYTYPSSKKMYNDWSVAAWDSNNRPFGYDLSVLSTAPQRRLHV